MKYTDLAVREVPVPASVTNLFTELRATVLNGVVSEHSKRNYAKVLDELEAFCLDRQRPLSRALLLEFRATMLARELSPSTINVKLWPSAIWSPRPGVLASSARRRRRR